MAGKQLILENYNREGSGEMIVPTTITLGIQCSKCGEMRFRTFSLFAFSHLKKESSYCDCGALLLNLSDLGRGSFGLSYPCIYCSDSHYIVTKRSKIFGKDTLQLFCPDNELPLGYFGPRQQVINSCEDIKKEFVYFAYQMVNDEEKESEFDNFFVVYAVMEKLGKMAIRDQLGCRCGNRHMAVEIMPDRIEIICGSCRAVGIIDTDNKEILRIIDDMGTIFLEENMEIFLSDVYKSHHLLNN